MTAACMSPSSACDMQELPNALRRFPGVDQRQARGALDPAHEWEGADLVVAELADTLRQMRTEASLLRYLSGLRALRSSPFLGHARQVARIRLQVRRQSSELPERMPSGLRAMQAV